MDMQEIEELVRRVCQELLKCPGQWLTFRQLSFRILGAPDQDAIVEAACQSRQDLFAFHGDKRVLLKDPSAYRPGFSPDRKQGSPEETGVLTTASHEYWVYVAEWDVAQRFSGPYRAVVHRSSCTHVDSRKHREEGVGYKNYWKSFTTYEEAVRFASDLHPWHPCPCINKL